MRPAKPDRVDVGANQGSARPLHRGFIVYLVAAVLIALACYLLGWGAIGCVANGYIYGAVFLVIFGLCMTAGNLMPLQLSNIKDVTSHGGTNREAPPEKTGAVQKGVTLLATTLIAAALLGLTGLLIKLFSGR